MTRLRNYFLTGLIVCAPLAITAYLVWSFIGWVDSWVKPYIPAGYSPDNYLPFAVPPSFANCCRFSVWKLDAG